MKNLSKHLLVIISLDKVHVGHDISIYDFITTWFHIQLSYWVIAQPHIRYTQSMYAVCAVGSILNCSAEETLVYECSAKASGVVMCKTSITESSMSFIYSGVQSEDEMELRSLTAWGKKLLSSLLVQPRILLDRLPDGSRVNRLGWAGIVFSVFWLVTKQLAQQCDVFTVT